MITGLCDLCGGFPIDSSLFIFQAVQEKQVARVRLAIIVQGDPLFDFEGIGGVFSDQCDLVNSAGSSVPVTRC